MKRDRILLVLMILYGAASLLHFAHNAVYIEEYPNLPRWITPFGVYASWCTVASIGVLGYCLNRAGARVLGLLVIAVYALLGFGGLDHYVLAPVSAHSIAMNSTILAEVVAASCLVVFVAHELLSSPRREN